VDNEHLNRNLSMREEEEIQRRSNACSQLAPCQEE